MICEYSTNSCKLTSHHTEAHACKIVLPLSMAHNTLVGLGRDHAFNVQHECRERGWQRTTILQIMYHMLVTRCTLNH
jgi:hypothetical protein